MTLIKTSLLNAIAVFVRMLTMLVLNKILAIYVGPAGYAAIGQFQNLISMVITFASGAINTGVTKYTAEHSGNPSELRELWVTATTIAVIGSLVIGIIIGFFHERLALLIFNKVEYGDIFLWFSFTLILFVLNSLLLAILNGKKEVYKYVSVNISGSIISLFVTGWLAFTYGVKGALIALAVNQSIVFFVTLYFCRKLDWFKLSNFIGKINSKVAKNLGSYTLMALTSAICIPVSQMLIRNHLGDSISWDSAGYWDAINKISSIYLMVVTTTLSVYFLPRIAEIKCNKELRKEIFDGYKVILPLAIFCCVVIYVCKDFLISLLFTPEFLPMRELFAWQMCGDLFKIASWLLAYVMLGRTMVKLFIVTEIAFSLMHVIFVLITTHYYGLEGAPMAYAINYLLYFLLMLVVIKRRIQ